MLPTFIHFDLSLFAARRNNTQNFLRYVEYVIYVFYKKILFSFHTVSIVFFSKMKTKMRLLFVVMH